MALRCVCQESYSIILSLPVLKIKQSVESLYHTVLYTLDITRLYHIHVTLQRL